MFFSFGNFHRYIVCFFPDAVFCPIVLAFFATSSWSGQIQGGGIVLSTQLGPLMVRLTAEPLEGVRGLLFFCGGGQRPFL